MVYRNRRSRWAEIRTITRGRPVGRGDQSNALVITDHLGRDTGEAGSLADVVEFRLARGAELGLESLGGHSVLP